MATTTTKIKAGVLVAILAVFLVGAAPTYAWGPERNTFTKAVPASYITFNSITDSDFGDERNFVLTKEVTAPADQWNDGPNVKKSGDYYVKIFVHNNAAANLNLVANNVRAMTHIATNDWVTRVQIDSIVAADNSNPKEIWDQVVFDSDSTKFKVEYLPNTAYYYNNANLPKGVKLSDAALFNTTAGSGGALLGYSQMDGKIPGCYQYSGYVLYQVRVTVETPDTPEKPVEPEKPEVPVEPEAPKELPKTGPGQVLLAGIVVAAVGVAVTYWIRSRKLVHRMQNEAEGRDKDGQLPKGDATGSSDGELPKSDGTGVAGTPEV
jgi:hypothetical protein